MLDFRSETFSVFRDDLYPMLGGGNKARKLMALHSMIMEEGYDALVTTGGIQSNHCRAVALYCEKYKIDCTLVLHGDEKAFKTQSGNAKIIRNTSAKLIFCESGQIAGLMDKAVENYTDTGKTPFYVQGGGHILEAAYTYVDVVKGIVDSGYVPDHIFVASGTGSTQAGILAGLAKYNLSTEVFGISVGRKKERGHEVVKDFYDRLCIKYNINGQDRSINFIDEYLCGGYGKYSSAIKNIEEKSIVDHNLFLDTTYTAKVFYAMQEIIKKKSLNGKVLFWYTGGVFNYLAE